MVVDSSNTRLRSASLNLFCYIQNPCIQRSDLWTASVSSTFIRAFILARETRVARFTPFITEQVALNTAPIPSACIRAFLLAPYTPIPGYSAINTDSVEFGALFVPGTFCTSQIAFRAEVIFRTLQVIHTYHGIKLFKKTGCSWPFYGYMYILVKKSSI